MTAANSTPTKIVLYVEKFFPVDGCGYRKVLRAVSCPTVPLIDGLFKASNGVLIDVRNAPLTGVEWNPNGSRGPTLYVGPNPHAVGEVANEDLPRIRAAVADFNARNVPPAPPAPPGVEVIS